MTPTANPNSLQAVFAKSFDVLPRREKLEVLGQLNLPADATRQKVIAEFTDLCRAVVQPRDLKQMAIASARLHALAMATAGEGAGAHQAFLDLLLSPTAPRLAPAAVAHGIEKPGLDVDRFFRACIKSRGSDLHLQVGDPPMLRLKGNIERMFSQNPMTISDMEKVRDDFKKVMPAKALRSLEETFGADFAYVVDDIRFRVSLFMASGKPALVARQVRNIVPTFEALNLPASMSTLCELGQGLILLAGATGSGKTTTIASMIDYINTRKQVKIATLEEPIEVQFTSKLGAVLQREIFDDVSDWPTALKQILRQDPDIVLVGEMRDKSTFRAGIEVASTGHLTFATIHADNAPSTIARVLDLFDKEEHPAVRQSLGFNLRAVVAQKLVPGLKRDRVPVTEIMRITPTIRDLIRKGQDDKLADVLAASSSEGMMTFNDCLHRLAEAGHIDKEVALDNSPNPDALKMLFKGIKTPVSGLIS